MRPSLEAAQSVALRPSFCPSVCSVPTIHSKSQSHRNFTFDGNMAMVTSNWWANLKSKGQMLRTLGQNLKIVLHNQSINQSINKHIYSAICIRGMKRGTLMDLRQTITIVAKWSFTVGPFMIVDTLTSKNASFCDVCLYAVIYPHIPFVQWELESWKFLFYGK